MKKTSRVSKSIQPSLTRKLFNMAKEYNDVIDLTLGDPDLIPPEEIQNAACQSIHDNKLHYSANAGLYEARKAVSDRIKSTRGVLYDPENEIILTAGGMEALYLTLLSIIDIDDEVIIFSPYYINYVQMVEMCGGKPVILNAYQDMSLKINKEELQTSITSKTIAIIINSPNNPTGQMFDEDSLNYIADIAEKNDLLVITDEVYRTLIFDNKPFKSILQTKNIKNRTVLIDSLSKEYSMTGWRIGYACGPSFIIENMVKMQENIIACAPLSSQFALIEAYNNDVDNSNILDTFQKRRDFLFQGINNIDGLKCAKPSATFYMFVKIESDKMNCEEFAYSLLEEQHVAVVPGIAYGEDYTNYVRIAFTKETDILTEALNKIKCFMDNIHWINM